jgi:hypothetical protein
MRVFAWPLCALLVQTEPVTRGRAVRERSEHPAPGSPISHQRSRRAGPWVGGESRRMLITESSGDYASSFTNKAMRRRNTASPTTINGVSRRSGYHTYQLAKLQAKFTAAARMNFILDGG